jgi:nitrogen fixation protein
VYAQDAAGRPSTDPDLYSRAQAGTYGARLVLADGFDGITVPNGFSIEGKGRLAAGSVVLAPGALLALPPMRTGQSLSVTADLSRDSGRTSTLLVQWEGSSAQAVAVPLTADTAGLSFRIASNGLSIAVPSTDGEKKVSLPAPAGSGASLLLKLENPPDAKSDLVIESILALSSPQ